MTTAMITDQSLSADQCFDGSEHEWKVLRHKRQSLYAPGVRIQFNHIRFEKCTNCKVKRQYPVGTKE
jgi:hypothetical protein